ncbi:hypothetical protein FOC1_g10011337 [Fusarium oxysporum f. sp. cubense race 1]|uniref:Uncharacterized protein n=1 Tax=Fusarium oxysporum f. sp. cubense (strain race 1) TaxID=1229664 RepID=N4UZ25_FUSC1|nr:hypothetical protein FOC1_g10011337 [Fusarium oxysporum f. sp. cubense race 1]
MRPRGILKKEILKSCASAEQRLLVENTTLPLHLSDECSAYKTYCMDKRTSNRVHFSYMRARVSS